MQHFNACRKLAYLKSGIDEREYSAAAYQHEKKLLSYKQLKGEGCSSKVALAVIGISRSTYGRWKRRYQRNGLLGLEYESRRPNKVRARQWSATLELHVRLLRKRFPVYGKYKITVLLAREYNIISSASTVGRVLKQLVMRGSIRPACFYYGRTKLKKRRVFDRYAQRWSYGMKASKPGEMIQIDHLIADVASQCCVRHFTATCPITRLTVEQVYARATSRSARDFLDYVCNQLPFRVVSVQVDGGVEFMDEFEQACKDRNIRLYVLPPRSPKFNGAVERRNGTARYEFYSMYNGKANLEEIRLYLKRFTHQYNTFRPHQALQYRTPWQCYLSSGANLSHMY